MKTKNMPFLLILPALLIAMPRVASAGTRGSLVQVVNKAATSTRVVTATSPITQGQAVLISAIVSPIIPSVPAGTIQIVANGVNSGAQVTSGQLSVGSNGSIVWNTSFSTADQYDVVGTYSGDSNYLSSISSQATETVTPASAPDFNVNWPSGITVVAGNSVTIPLTVTSMNGFSGTVIFSCSTFPTGSTCLFSNTSVIVPSALLNGTPTNAETTMSISTTALSVITSGAFLFMLGFAGKKRERAPRIVFGVCVLFLTIGFSGCAGNRYTQQQGIAPGIYPVTITATSGSIVHSQAINLKVTAAQ